MKRKKENNYFFFYCFAEVFGFQFKFFDTQSLVVFEKKKRK